jgi:cytoskeletal protein CcmA (bactofilin family)
MFERKKGDLDGASEEGEGPTGRPPLKPFTRLGNHAGGKPPSPAVFRADPGRRVERARPGVDSGDTKKLTVGRDICLKGEISSCDKLVVEGRVEATLQDARSIEVAAGGFFKGDCQVDEADIRGVYEGRLIARSKLTVRAQGKLSGSIRYGRIIIEAGGEISGDMQTLTPSEGRIDDHPEEPPADYGVRSSTD